MSDRERLMAALADVVELDAEFVTNIVAPVVDDIATERSVAARAEAFRAAANRLTIEHPQAVLNWCSDQARIALGQEPYRKDHEGSRSGLSAPQSDETPQTAHRGPENRAEHGVEFRHEEKGDA